MDMIRLTEERRAALMRFPAGGTSQSGRIGSDYQPQSARIIGHGGRVPSRCSEPLERGLLGGLLVEMHRLQIEFR
jgi:hypothetical protein